MNEVTPEMIECWKINYGLDKRTPEQAALWWQEESHGMAPAGAVAALGLCILEIERLRAAPAAVPDLEDALAAYWDAAYTEGQQGRTHDTPDGAAQTALNALRTAIAAAAIRALDEP